MIPLPPSLASIDPQSLALLVGGLIGGIGRAACGQHPTLSKRTIMDAAIGPIVALVYPIFGPGIPAGTPLVRIAALGVVIGLFGSYLLTWVLWRMGVFKKDIRADRPGNGGPSE